VLLLATPALAADGDPVAGLPQAGLRAVAALGGVLALILALAWLLRRFREASRAATGGPALESVARLDLGARREIRLVRAAGRLLVVGVTEKRCELITELDDDAIPASANGEEKAPPLEVLRKLATSP
jgi:flagellar biosynthetic protein FliO